MAEFKLSRVVLEGHAFLGILRASEAERAEIERVLATPDKLGLAMTPFGVITLAGAAAGDDAPDSADAAAAAALAAYVPTLDVERERTTLAQRAGMLEHWTSGFVASDVPEESPGLHRRLRRETVTSPAAAMTSPAAAMASPAAAMPTASFAVVMPPRFGSTVKGTQWLGPEEVLFLLDDVMGDGVSAVKEWLASRGEQDRWRAPVHEVDSDAWKEAFAFKEAIGRGGFGTVFRATHLATGTELAIKLVHDMSDDGAPSAKSESVRREVETMSRTDHPDIVSLIEVFVMKPHPQQADTKGDAPWVRRWYLVLELCQGHDLQHLISAHGALELDLVRAIFGQLAHVIQYLHWRGVIHRDIKPGNVMLLDPDPVRPQVRTKLLDFGLAESLDGEFIAYYRSSARARAAKCQVKLDAYMLEQDSLRPASSRRRGGGGDGAPAYDLGRAAAQPPPPAARDGRSGVLGAISRALGSDASGNAVAYDDEDASKHRGRLYVVTPPNASPLVGGHSGGGGGGGAQSLGARRAQQGASATAAMALDAASAARGASRPKPEPSRMSQNFIPIGTEEFAAPEVYDARRFTAAKAVGPGGQVAGVLVATPLNTDSYSLGVLLQYALTGAPPGADVNRYVRLRRLSPFAALRGCAGGKPYRLRTLDELPEDARALVRGLTDPDYHTRLTMGDIMSHPWVVEASRALAPAARA